MNKQVPMLDKQRVRGNFERAAAQYDTAAVLQREVAARLLERLDYVRIDPAVILDVGAGTGFLATGMRDRYAGVDVIEMDLAINMLRQIRKKTPWFRRPFNKKILLCADAEQLPLASNSVDLLVSSLAIQWCNDLQHTFSEFMRVLRPGGLVMFTTFGPDTLQELRQSWASVDQQAHVNPFFDMHDVGDMLLNAGLAEPVMDVEHFTLTYPHVSALTRDLKRIGASNSLLQRPRAMTGKQAYRSMEQAYEGLRDNGTLPASYEVIYGHAWKAAQQQTQVEFHREVPGR